MKAVVLCGGLGTRLGDLVARSPKPLLPVGGRPLLHWTLDWLARQGVVDVAINLHYLSEHIVASVGDGSAFGVRVHYLSETTLLGTGGTVRALRDWFGGDDALVVYGDLWIHEQLSRFIELRSRAEGVLLVHQRTGSNSAIELDERGLIRTFVERPTPAEWALVQDPWVNSGVALLSPRYLATIPEQIPCDLARDVFAPNVANGVLSLAACPLLGERVAIDSPERLELANALAGRATLGKRSAVNPAAGGAP